MNSAEKTAETISLLAPATDLANDKPGEGNEKLTIHVSKAMTLQTNQLNHGFCFSKPGKGLGMSLDIVTDWT